VQQSTKVELVIDMNTAKALDLAIPRLLFARADGVINRGDAAVHKSGYGPTRKWLSVPTTSAF
jgi:hypothetical protein